MDTKHNPNSENEQEQRICCHICGYSDTDHYCSKCGTALVSYEWVGESALSTIRQQLGEQLLELILPILAAIKTFWLIVFKPKPFFGALFRREGKINDTTSYFVGSAMGGISVCVQMENHVGEFGRHPEFALGSISTLPPAVGSL